MMTRLAFEVVAATIRGAALIWLLLRLLLAAALVAAGLPVLGGLKHFIVIVAVTVSLVLLDARRMHERVFSENLGLSELAIGSIALLTAVVLEILLFATRLLSAGV